MLRRVLRFYWSSVSIVQAKDISKYILAILTAVESQWPIGIFFEIVLSFALSSMLWASLTLGIMVTSQSRDKSKFKTDERLFHSLTKYQEVIISVL